MDKILFVCSVCDVYSVYLLCLFAAFIANVDGLKIAGNSRFLKQLNSNDTYRVTGGKGRQLSSMAATGKEVGEAQTRVHLCENRLGNNLSLIHISEPTRPY